MELMNMDLLRSLASAAYVFLQLCSIVILYQECQNPTTMKILKGNDLLDSPHLGFIPNNTSLTLQDRSDSNWLSLLLWLSFIPYIGLYLVSAVLINISLSKKFPMLSSCARTIASGLLIAYLSGPATLLSTVFLTIFFFILGRALREYKLIIAALIGLIMFYSEDITTVLFDRRFPSSPIMSSVIGDAYLLGLLRAGSVALTPYSKLCHQNIVSFFQATSSTSSLKAILEIPTLYLLVDSLEYSLLPYTFYFGPLITYEDWLTYRSGKLTTKDVSRAKLTGRLRSLTWLSLLFRAGRLIFWFHLWSLFLCSIYPMALFHYGALSKSFNSDLRINPWNTVGGLQLSTYTVFTALHAVGLHFYIFHVFLYGIPGLLADIEHCLSRRNIPVLLEVKEKCPSSDDRSSSRMAYENDPPPELCLVVAPPSCVLHIALFSEMWRTFDRGLYGFMRCHIYGPLLSWPVTSSTCWRCLSRGLALTLPFFFVLLYHSVLLENVIWSAINLFSFALELSFKWLLRNTSLLPKLRLHLHPCFIELMGIGCEVIMWLLSLCGFIFFLFGSYTGLCFVAHIVLSPHMLLYILLYICGMYFIKTVRTFCGYRGFPVTFNKHNACISPS